MMRPVEISVPIKIAQMGHYCMHTRPPCQGSIYANWQKPDELSLNLSQIFFRHRPTKGSEKRTPL